MDFQASLDQLERAAQVIMAPPNLTSKPERDACEQIVYGFRKSRGTFELCKYILEKSRTEFVLFEASQLLRENLILDWEKIGNTESVQTLAPTLLNLLLQSSGVPFSVERRLAGIIALIVKHQFASQNGTQRSQLVAHLQTLITGGGRPLIVSCLILDALIGEHQFIVNVSDHSLPFELHFTAKKDFENTDLAKILKSCVLYLNSYQSASGQVKELEAVLKLTESIFCWHFCKSALPRRIIAVLEMDIAPTFKPPTSWAEIVTDPGFVSVFFDIHEKMRNNENFVPRTISLMIQLVSMHGPLVSAKESRVEFLTRLLPRFTSLLGLLNKLPAEVLGLSDLVRKVLLFHRTSTLCALNQTILHPFLRAVGTFTCQVLGQGVLEEANGSVEDRIFRDSTTRVLEAWMNILTDTDEIPKELLISISTDIFNTYIYGRLSPPQGYRPVEVQSTSGMDQDEDEKDSVQFSDQLQAIGLFARFVLSHSIPLLTNLLTFKCQEFQNQLHATASGVAGAKELLTIIYEDIHWILLIAGYTISFEGVGETNLIPSEVINLAISSASNKDQSLTALQASLNMQVSGEESVDPLVKLVCCVLSFCEMERRLLESNMGHLLSPEVSCNVIWFLHRWAQVYFVYNDDNYSEMSESFRHCFGATSPASALIQAALFRRIRHDLVKFSGEDEVIHESISLLYSLICSDKKALLAVQSPELIPLVQLTGTIGPGPGRYQMSNPMYRQFMRSMMLIGNFCNNDRRIPYWDQILVPLNSRYQNFAGMNPSEKHRDDLRLELASVLSGYIGIAMSCESRIASELFAKISPVATQCGAILGVFHNYLNIVELCLEFITEIGKRCLSYLSRADSMTLYQAALSVINAYASNASGMKSIEENAEEDMYNDLVLLVEMLISLLTKDFLDLSPDAHLEDGVSAVSASEVVLRGLEIIMPLMNADLLRFPSLSNRYFRLVTFLSELHPDKLVVLSPWMLQNLFDSVKLGLTQSVQENFNFCCDFLMCVVNSICRNRQQATQAGELVKPFLKIFMDMILLQDVGKDSVGPIACALFAIISAFQELYVEYTNHLLATVSTDQKRNDLTDAFRKLTDQLNLEAGGDRVSRSSFRERLEVFIHYARGCID